MEWISVKDRLPYVGQYCVVTDGADEALATHYREGEFIYFKPPVLKAACWKPADILGDYVDRGTNGELDFIPSGVVLVDGEPWIPMPKAPLADPVITSNEAAEAILAHMRREDKL